MQTRRIGFACALGAFVGATVSLDLARHFAAGNWLWIVGILLGGLVGYLAYDFRAVASAIGQAWREVSAWRPDWKGIGAFLKHRALCGNIGALMMLSVLTWVFVLCSGGQILTPSGSVTSAGRTFVLTSLIAGYLLGLILPMDEGDRKAMGVLTLCFAPITGPFIWAYWVLRGTGWIIRRVPEGVLSAIVLALIAWPVLVRFVKRVFVLVHSDERKLCFTDAMLGAMIGFFLGSAVLGGIAGALLGVVNYELVSIRLLHLPRRA
jgi:hypothetical protein